MALTMASFMEMSVYGLLLVLFMVFFGIPSVQKYQSKETISLSSEKLTNGIEAPAVTLFALNNNTGYGWKSKTNQTSSVNGRYTHTFLLDHCKEINQTDLAACISNDSFALTDFLKTATFQMKGSSLNEKNTSYWREDIDITADGRHFTWKPQRFISPAVEDFVFITVRKNFKFYIYVHDVNFYVLSTNPYDICSMVIFSNGRSLVNKPKTYIVVHILRKFSLNGCESFPSLSSVTLTRYAQC